MLKLSGVWLCGLSSVPQGSGLSRLWSSLWSFTTVLSSPKELCCFSKRFPGFPRHSDGRVIVDTHPDYAPLCTNEVIGDNKCWGTYGNFSLELQCGPIFNKDGEASCFTFEQMLQSLIWINPRYTLRIINHSDDILPSQVSFKDEHGNDFCTKINLLDKYSSEEMREEF